jgi:signal transduction histidine kinase
VRLRALHTESVRLTAIYVAIFAASVIALGAFLLPTVEAAMRDQIVQYARANIAAIQNAHDSEGEPEAREVALQLLAGRRTADFILLQGRGGKLEGNLPAMPSVMGLAEIARPGLPGHKLLGFGAQIAPGLYAFSGSDLEFVSAVRRRVLNGMLWLFGGALLLAGAGGIFVSRSFLARMDAIANTCRAIMAGNLKDRIPMRGSQDEMDRLSGTINAMLDRISALMENVRQVSNDVAHDLRTPLTHLRHRLERARTDAATPAEYLEALDAAIASTDEMLNLFSALLRIAQIEAGARRAGFGQVELAPLLQKLQEVYGAVAEDAAHTLTVSPAGGAVHGDRELLFQLLANLVENALVHTPDGTHIDVVAVLETDAVTIHVRDNGPGVAESERGKLFRRFYRGDASRTTPGHGLGLSLVEAVAELHGGHVALGDSRSGLDMQVRLPLADAVR